MCSLHSSVITAYAAVIQAWAKQLVLGLNMLQLLVIEPVKYAWREHCRRPSTCSWRSYVTFEDEIGNVSRPGVPLPGHHLSFLLRMQRSSYLYDVVSPRRVKPGAQTVPTTQRMSTPVDAAIDTFSVNNIDE
jgi:hypothetical protein